MSSVVILLSSNYEQMENFPYQMKKELWRMGSLWALGKC